jgi:hypothetical protein
MNRWRNRADIPVIAALLGFPKQHVLAHFWIVLVKLKSIGSRSLVLICVVNKARSCGGYQLH